MLLRELYATMPLAERLGMLAFALFAWPLAIAFALVLP